ncbi:hypothetical protein GQF61_07550 [Sphingobacterium sp. DK4209]|uniref:SusD-like N-terminal domain-containing protein n=1 Tax=Sphingobacterium zhuxiongii TaxID=2662364 RepID=A0A5Q0QCK7_9SPHI|nr:MULTISPECIES: RagB/SusD family nutrient uptake outer membrane protein [unclassified Sphingobacterium]MVZ65709.1 hypothetical protein [Sphingobacterium sp. DK4209]QGA27907.1 hypothetical protein GFH32_16940 [Sphingobacterium sp. dk4302]
MRKFKTLKFALRGLFCTTVFLILSCSKWIDVNAPEQLTLDESLKSKQGFVKILTGIYATMGDASLYGRELEFGMLDVLAGYWEVPNNHIYHSDYNFSYDNDQTKKRIFQIWSDLYMLIRQCNTLLEHVDSIKSDPDYELLKGEILALRAFFHFELFRLFGPVMSQQGVDKKTLPYYTDTKIQKTEPVLNSTYLSLVEQDLLQAIALMKDDPILTSAVLEEELEQSGPYNFITDRRKQHLNIYAAQALLCRKYSWQGNHVKAAEVASALLVSLKDEKTARFLNIWDQYGNPPDKDIRFNMESLWGLQIRRMNEMTSGYLYDVSNPRMKLKTAYETLLRGLFAGGSGNTNDIRYLWWTPYETFYKLFDLSLADSNVAPDQYQIAQLISLPELYFILCEAFLQTDPKLALDYLNLVRQSRTIDPIDWSINMPTSVLQELLLDEIRREYIGEGVLFLHYKKWFHPIYRAQGTMSPSIEKFVWPIPAEENL